MNFWGLNSFCLLKQDNVPGFQDPLARLSPVLGSSRCMARGEAPLPPVLVPAVL